MKTISQALLLATSFLLVFLWNQFGLIGYTAPIIGFMVFIFIVLSARSKGKNKLTIGGPLGVFILNTITFFLIFTTGGIDSALFFMLFFLIFSIGFAFEPLLVFIFGLGAFAVLLPQALETNSVEAIAKSGSLILISPLAYFFGNQFRKQDARDDEVVAIKERSKDAADTISKDVATVLEDEKASLKQEDVEKLNEVLEETEDLRAERRE